MAITNATIATCPKPRGCGITARGLKAIKEIFGTRCEGIVLNPQSLCKPCRSADASRRRAEKKAAQPVKFSKAVHAMAKQGKSRMKTAEKAAKKVFPKLTAPQIRKMYKEKFPEGRHKNISVMRKLLGL